MSSSLLERVQEALERAAFLPPEQQERVAADTLSVIDNALWDAQLRDPANQAAHEALIAEELGVEDASADETGSTVAAEQE